MYQLLPHPHCDTQFFSIYDFRSSAGRGVEYALEAFTLPSEGNVTRYRINIIDLVILVEG